MNINCNVTEIRSGYDRKICWVQTRAGIVPDQKKAVITTQKLRLTGSDIFYGICTMISCYMGRVRPGRILFRRRHLRLAPLVMAEFDEENLCLIKDSEMVVVPQRGARLGNFGVTPVSDSESWVVVSEWMQGLQGGKSLDDIEQYGADNTFFISKLTV